MKIALIGVDGAGKTTILTELNKIKNTKTLYMGFRNFKFQGIVDLLGKVGKVGIIFQHIFVYFENLARIYKANKLERDGYIVLFDRYPAIDYQVASKSSQLIYKILYKYFFPLPDRIILIKGEKNEIYKRKPELTLDEIEELQSKLEKISVIDAIVHNKTGELESTLSKVKNIAGLEI